MNHEGEKPYRERAKVGSEKIQRDEVRKRGGGRERKRWGRRESKRRRVRERGRGRRGGVERSEESR